MKINNSNMARAENYKTTLLDFEVTADVTEVMVTFERETRVPVCNNYQHVVCKRNLEVISDGNVSIYKMLMFTSKKLDIGKQCRRKLLLKRIGSQLTFAANFLKQGPQFFMQTPT